MLIILLLPNCEDIITCDEECQIKSQSLVDEANDALFPDLRAISEKEFGEDYFDSLGTGLKNLVDLDNSYGKYEKALESDPENTGGNFGAGYMGVAMITQDEEFESTLNQWAECFDSLGVWGMETAEPSVGNSMPRSIINNNEYKMGIPQSRNAFFNFDAMRILKYIPIITSHEDILSRNEFDCPEI